VILKFSIILAIILAFAAVLLVPTFVEEVEAALLPISPSDWVSSSSCGPNNPDCRGTVLPENSILIFEKNGGELHKVEIFIDKADCQNNYYSPNNCSSVDPNEIFSRWDSGVQCISGMTMWGNEYSDPGMTRGLDGPTNSICDGTITVTKISNGVYQYAIDTSNLSNGEHKIILDSRSSATSSSMGTYTILVGDSNTQAPDVTAPVITIPELTTDQWGNENLELSMSGTTNFPTGSWTVTATDNVGVIICNRFHIY
jgi:hypothetical protein